MSSFEKVFITVVLVADLLAVIYFGGQFIVTGSLIPHAKHDTHASLILPEDHGADHGTAAAAPVKPAFDWATFVPDLAKGQQAAAKCKACHTFEAGGANKIGPNMWQIIGHGIAEREGFTYSAAFNELKGQKVWTRESMDEYLKNPKKYIPGTKMAFPGIRSDEERANLIMWLETLK